MDDEDAFIEYITNKANIDDYFDWEDERRED